MKRRRILIHSHEFSAAHRQALEAEGFEIVAVSQGRLEGLEHVSLGELYYGSPRLQDFARRIPARAPLPDRFVRQYARGIGRLGFLPDGDYYSFAGGGVPLIDLEDWAALHWRYAAGLLKAWSIDEVWFWWAPHLGVDQALWQAAQDLGLTCLSLRQLPFVNKFTASGARHERVRLLPLASAQAWSHGARTPELFYMRPEMRRPFLTAAADLGRDLLGKLFTRAGRDQLLTRAYLGASKRAWRPLIEAVEMLAPALRPLAGLRRWQRRQWDAGRAARRFTRLDEIREPFVYFALHYEPELNSDVYGGEFANQIDALGRLVARLPEGWRLLVKENPQQQFLKRSWAFFERCGLLDRMDFVPDDTDSARLIERAAVVASLCGTVVYEAMLRGKCGIYFGDPWYAGLTGAVCWSDDLDLQAVASRRVDRAMLDTEINQWLSTCPDGIVAPRFDALLPDNGNWQSQAQITAASLRKLSDSLAAD
jgi:hypothetical protein